MFYGRSYMTANTTLENKRQENNNNRQIILQGHRASTEIHTMKQKATDTSSEIRRVLTHSPRGHVTALDQPEFIS